MRRHRQESLTDPPKAPADDELLLTKLYLPPARPDLVSRPSLIAKLAAGLAGPLTLIAAPAGYGKTTLLGAWQASPEGAGHRVGWLSLDGDDDDPIRFLRYVVAALEMAAPGVGAEPARMLRSSQPPPVRTVIGALLNRLAEPQDDLVLVLDDYQVLENPAVHDTITYLLEHRPPHLHLAILSRMDPPLPLARLRGRGQVAEIREADLRFTAQEAGRFLTEVMQLNLSEQELAVVADCTEGWAAGLQLAALSMQGRSDKASFLEEFGCNSRYIVGYLVEEVVNRQSGEVQDFLLRTSVLDRLCAPLCAALLDGRAASGPDGGQDAALASATGILEYLERANLFTVPLDEAGYWYRYHHLFRDFLRSRLQRLRPSEIQVLHRRASRWYEAEGLVPEAVKHAFLSRDLAYAADVVERHGMWMLMHSDIHTVHEWCTALPEEVMRAHPMLCLYHAGTLVLAYRNDNRNAVEQRLQQAENAAAALEDKERARLLAAQAAVTRTFLWLAPNPAADPHEQLAAAQRALDLLRSGDSLCATTRLSIGYAHLALQDPQAAADALEDTQRLGLAGQDYYAAVDAVFHQARLAHSQGQLGRAMQICEQGKERFRTLFAQAEHGLPALGCLDIAQGCVLLEQNSLGQAEAALRHGLDLIGWGTNPYYRMIACTALFRLCELQGRYVEALEFADEPGDVWPDVRFCTQALRVLHSLRSAPEQPQTLAAAAAWCESFSLPVDEHLPLPGIGPFGGGEAFYLAWLAWARAQIAIGRPQATFSYLERQTGLAEERDLNHRLIEMSIVMALALHGLGENKRACEALGRALAAAEPAGYIRTFDEGPALTRLLVETAARGISGRYIARLLAVFGDVAASEPALSTIEPATPPQTATAPSRIPASPLVEPLTSREREVLGLLAEGFSNVDIAQKLYIEVGTVKQHVNHLMGKLEATNRTQAVARARALGLLA